MDKDSAIIAQIEENLRLHRYLQQNTPTLITIADRITQAFRSGGKLLLCGNGGSAADAQHIASELMGKFHQDRAPLPAIALTADTSLLTAVANDYDYGSVFSRQVRGLANSKDIIFGISTSGNSANVLSAIEEAKHLGAMTIAFTGQEGKLKDTVDLVLAIPSNETPRIQEAHITAGHILCHLIEEALFGGE